MRANACVVACAASFAGHAFAQEGTREVTVTVTSSGDRSVFFDRGRDAGLAPGTLVRLFPPGAGELEVEVRAVTHTSARADLPSGLPVPPVGTRGVARVAAPVNVAPAPPSQPSPGAPAHPPWTRQEEPRAPDQPLLVPAYRRRPDERPATFDGRLFSSLQWSRDDDDDRSAEYLLARLGVRADATNVVGEAERWQFAGETWAREYTVDGAGDDDLSARLDVLSVAFGVEEDTPLGAHVGRFLSPHLPELGLVDGVEVVARFEGGLRLGGGGGSYPLPFPARANGDDVGVHAFVDWTADTRRSVAVAVGVQKTWHRGEPDRDLVLLRAEWRPDDMWWVLGSARVDFYTSSDVVKGHGAELTEAYVQAGCTGDVLGTGVTASHFTWPELLRDEYQDLPPELVRDGYVDRGSWWGSWRVSEPLSLRVRADVWRDQDRDGTAFGADGDWRGLWNDTSSLSLGAFANDGGYTAGPGARASLRERFGDASVHASWRWYRYESSDLIGGPETWVRQSAELGASWPIGSGGDVEVSAERWFGDRDDATYVNVFLQWSF